MNYEFVFGKNPVLEIIENSSVQVNKIWINSNLKDEHLKERVISFAKEKKIPFNFVPDAKLYNLVNHKNHQGVVLSISPIEYLPLHDVISHAIEKQSDKVILIAHEIEDNHNLGAIIRTYVAGGCSSIVLTGKTNVGVNATTIKTSAGTVFQTKIARATNCVQVIDKLKDNGFWILGADVSSDAQSIFNTSFPEQIAIILGNEHEGLSNLIKKNCDFLVNIPINSKVDSLNVSVAFGIIYYEFLRNKSKLINKKNL